MTVVLITVCAYKGRKIHGLTFSLNGRMMIPSSYHAERNIHDSVWRMIIPLLFDDGRFESPPLLHGSYLKRAFMAAVHNYS